MSNLEPIFVIGAGGQAKCINDAIRKGGKYSVAGFVVDKPPSPGAKLFQAPILSFEQLLDGRAVLPRKFVVGIGNNEIREQKTIELEQAGFEAVSVIHPFTSIGEGVKFGRGLVMLAGSMVDPEATLGDGVLLNVAAAVGHNAVIGNFTHISAGAYVGAGCIVGDRTFLAMRATLISGPKVGQNVFIGAGSLVTKDVPSDMNAFGSPARLRRKEPAPDAEPAAEPAAAEPVAEEQLTR